MSQIGRNVALISEIFIRSKFSCCEHFSECVHPPAYVPHADGHASDSGSARLIVVSLVRFHRDTFLVVHEGIGVVTCELQLLGVFLRDVSDLIWRQDSS